jgi:hypothetical protein
VDPLELQQAVGKLVDAWCDRRSLRALREILAGYPIVSGLTDDWAELLKALEGVRAFARDELTDDEAERVDQLIGAASAIVHR